MVWRPITLTRPDTLNSLTFEVYQELTRRVRGPRPARRRARGDDHGRGQGVLLGRRRRTRSSASSSRATCKGLVAFTRVTGALIRNIRAVRKPVVAAVNGTAVGAGAVIALASDFRIASTSREVRLHLPARRALRRRHGRGLLLPRVVGLGACERAAVPRRRRERRDAHAPSAS